MQGPYHVMLVFWPWTAFGLQFDLDLTCIKKVFHMADYYSFLDKYQNFRSSFARYTGPSTYQSDYIQKTIMNQRSNLPYIPPHVPSRPYVSLN